MCTRIKACLEKSWGKFLLCAIIVLGIVLCAYILRHKLGVIFSKEDIKRTSSNAITQQYLDQLDPLKSKVKENPDSVEYQQQLAVALYATGDYDGARKAYEKAVLLDGSNAVLHNNLGNAYRDLANFDGAIREYRKALELSPTLSTGYANLANIYLDNLNQPNDALLVYADGLKNIPGFIDFYLGKAVVYERQGISTKAIETYKEILKIQPNNPSAMSALKRLGK